MNFICSICGYIYDGKDFTKEPSDFQCPLCDASKKSFSKRNIDIEVCDASDQYYHITQNK